MPVCELSYRRKLLCDIQECMSGLRGGGLSRMSAIATITGSRNSSDRESLAYRNSQSGPGFSVNFR